MTAKNHLDPHDRQMAAIRALVRECKRLGLETRIDPRVAAAILKRCEARAQKLSKARV